MMAHMPMLWKKVQRKMAPSSPTRPVAAQATAMLWGEIILPVTPPLELEATIRLGSTPIPWAVVFCNDVNRALEEVSDPVRKTPTHPRKGEKKGKRTPAEVKAS